MKALTTFIVLILLAVAISCGGSGKSDPESEIRRDVEAFVDAFSKGEAGNAYSFMSKECRDQVSREDFASAILLAKAFMGDNLKLSLESLEIVTLDGDTAEVKTKIRTVVDGEEQVNEDSEETQHLVKEDGKWRSTDCADFSMESGLDSSGAADGNSADSGADAVVELRSVSLNETLDLDAGKLEEIYSDEKLSGNIEVRFTKVEVQPTIETEYYGQKQAQGKFVIVHYEVKSDLDGKMQPSSQINNGLVLTDSRERRWENADYQGEYYGISADVAKAAGCKDPSSWIGAGFSGCADAVFDVPTDASGFSLVWKTAGITVDLGQ
jgi:hypothetical protein